SRTANLATLITILFVQVIPWLVIAFASSMLMMAIMMSKFFSTALTAGNSPGVGPTFTWIAWYPLLSAGLAAVLSITKDVGFIIWSRKKLYSSFREQAAQTPGQPRFA